MSYDREREYKWHRRFLQMAELVASWSKDPSTKVGAVIVRPDRSVCSVGFNGFPRGVADDMEMLNNREHKYERVIHAEMNAILAANEPVRGHTLYVWPPGVVPTCSRCTAHVIQAGITTVVCPAKEEHDDGKPKTGWRSTVWHTPEMYKQAGVRVITDV